MPFLSEMMLKRKIEFLISLQSFISALNIMVFFYPWTHYVLQIVNSSKYTHEFYIKIIVNFEDEVVKLLICKGIHWAKIWRFYVLSDIFRFNFCTEESETGKLPRVPWNRYLHRFMSIRAGIYCTLWWSKYSGKGRVQKIKK